MLRVDGLTAQFRSRLKTTRAIDDVAFEIPDGVSFGLVGETGSGKSVTLRSIIGLLPPNGHVVSGTVEFEGRDLLRCSRREMRAVRGHRIGFVAQNPFGALNPILSIEKQFANVIRAHRKVSRSAVRELALERLLSVQVRDPERVLRGYAHELSGGMAQRVVIAMAMIHDPSLVIADEPTTALDVTVQRQILDLIEEQVNGSGRSMLLVTHDLGVVAQYCQQVGVMRSGRLVEVGPVADVFTKPQHPYTQQLLAAVPGRKAEAGAGQAGSLDDERQEVAR
jgi:ABC-type dipeptide/oligopeptide/nickel transport system ATPase component